MTPAAGAGRVLAAPDSFKGTYTADEVAAALSRGARAAGAEADELPVADGGEGTAGVLAGALGGELRTATATDPLGRAINAGFAMLPGGTAVVEVAAASGLPLVSGDERDAWRASSRGTGELVAAAAGAGASRVLVAAGGSASTDGGAGAIEVLAGVTRLPPISVLCDVETPFEDAPRLFAPQKGADPETVSRLEGRLHDLATAAPRDPRGVPMSGAAGGLAGGLWAHLGAELVPGARWVLDAIGFDERAGAANLVITGEGRLDATSVQGKAVGEVARRCRRDGVRCAAVAGSVDLDGAEWSSLGLSALAEASTVAEIEAAAKRLSLGADGR